MKTKNSADFAELFDSVIGEMKSLGPFLDEDFKNDFRRVFHFLRGYADVNGPPDLGDKTRMRGWLRRTHKGWKFAIKTIVESLIELLDQKSDVEKLISESHINKKFDEKEKQTSLKRRIDLKIIVLRRCMDHIAWTMLKGEPSSIRRLSLPGGTSNFSKENILEALDTVEECNRDPDVVAIPSDVTTFIHIGDVFVLNIKTGVAQFVELKRGEKNFEFSKAAFLSKDDPDFERDYTKNMSSKDLKHFYRAKKQAVRGANVLENLVHGTGTDNFTGRKFVLSETPEVPKKFAKDIVDLRRKLEDKNWAIAMVDECVFLGVYKELNKLSVGAFGGWVAALGCSSKVVNITESFRYPHATPFTAMDLPTDLLNEIFEGKVHILMCLDLRRLIEKVNDTYGSVVTLKKSIRDGSEFSNVDDLLLDGKQIIFTINNQEVQLGTGILDRVYFGLESPLHFVSQMIKYSRLNGLE